MFSQALGLGVPPSGRGGIPPSSQLGMGYPYLSWWGGYPTLPNRGYPIIPDGAGQEDPHSSWSWWWWVPLSGLDGYPPPIKTGWRYPSPLSSALDRGTLQSRLEGVTLPPCQETKQQSEQTSTCYAAGSMPLVFTQEDFLVVCCMCVCVTRWKDRKKIQIFVNIILGYCIYFFHCNIVLLKYPGTVLFFTSGILEQESCYKSPTQVKGDEILREVCILFEIWLSEILKESDQNNYLVENSNLRI